MIHDLTDLERLLHQYDPEKILVGPLLNLWTNSSFRVFNIAGKGGKIHETIGLGFVELDRCAKTTRRHRRCLRRLFQRRAGLRQSARDGTSGPHAVGER